MSNAIAPLLDMRSIRKTFAGIVALDGVDLIAYPGEVLALMGENGAGKSTLMKVLSGVFTPDQGGQIFLDGREIAITNPIVARASGISIIHQELALSPNLTVAENIFLGAEPSRWGAVDRRQMATKAEPLLRSLGARFTTGAIVSSLSIADRQLVEIARALNGNSRILIMDEPTTALSNRETDRLFDTIRRLRQEGLGIIYISHRMNEVYELADRVTVLRDGRNAGTLTRDRISPEAIVQMMVGRDISSFYRKQHGFELKTATPALDVRDLSARKLVQNCSLTVYGGEVVGLAGLVGAGRTELARLIYGADPLKSGTIHLAGKSVTIRSPADAIRQGVAYLTEDRNGEGLMLDMSCSDNINIGVMGIDAHFAGIRDRRRAQARSEHAIRDLTIKVRSGKALVGGLSGGNQQKVLLSRLLETRPTVLILDEPTRGVDVGAKAEIYKIIDSLARGGTAILVISSELPEIVGIADRVVVMREGRIAGEVRPSADQPITQEAIMSLATSSTPILLSAQRTRLMENAQQTVPASDRHQTESASERASSLVRAAGMLPVLIILCVAFHLLSGRFFSGQNLSIVLQQASVNTVLGAGMTFVILTGGIDLSVGSVLAAAAMIGLVISNIPELAYFWPIAAIVGGLGFGLANAVLIAWANLPPFIVTLGSLTAIRGIARLVGQDTTIFNPNIPYAFLGNSSINIGVLEIPWLALIAIATILMSWFVLRRTVLGVRIYAVGGNPAAARLAGVKVPGVLLFVYGASGLLAGLGGVMMATRLYAANGLQLGSSYELDAIAAVILGGTSFVGGIGSIWGTLVGALIIAVLSNGLILVGVSDVWQYVIKGVVIVAAVGLDRYRLAGSPRT